MDMESRGFPWERINSVRRTEGNMSEVRTLNSGGVVSFALFNNAELDNDDADVAEPTAVIQFSSMEMATQSKRLGYEFAKHLGVNTPQARVIQCSSPEWEKMKDAAKKVHELAVSIEDKQTSLDLLEALKLSYCLLLMNYIHGSHLLETPKAFDSLQNAKFTASNFGRVLLLDLILCNEDRLPCRQLSWHGNPANLLLSEKGQRENSQNNEGHFGNFTIFAINSGVPKRRMRQMDREIYPKVVELILNNSDFSSNILHQISGRKLGFPEGKNPGFVSPFCDADVAAIVHEFRCGFRTAVRDLQSFHLFLRALYQKLEGLLRAFSSMLKVKELKQCYERIKADVIKFCQENNFNNSFFDRTDINIACYVYELKVRLEHILETILIITEASNTERPSKITSNLFIGGVLAAKSIYTLQHLNITHILCLCSNEIGQSDSQFPDLFHYKNFSISDDDDADISGLFEEALEYIDQVEKSGGKVLVHCFEGKSRSSTVVLAYLILRKNYTLSEAWSLLKPSHKRAQPSDGFARVLLSLDERTHGSASMAWPQKPKPEVKLCPLCGKAVGLCSASLELHLLSHEHVEVQKVVEGIRVGMGISRTGRPTGFAGQAEVSAWPEEN